MGKKLIQVQYFSKKIDIISLVNPIPGIDPRASAMLNISFSDISLKDRFQITKFIHALSVEDLSGHLNQISPYALPVVIPGLLIRPPVEKETEKLCSDCCLLRCLAIE